MTPNVEIGAPPDLVWVPIEEIIVDSSYQRELQPRRVRKMVEEFEWRHFGAIVLSRQKDGRYAVTEGQHRLEAARLHPGIDKVPAVVINGMDLKAEAANFVQINTARAAVSSIDRFWAAITAEDETALRIRRVLESAGCDVVPERGAKKPHLTNAVSAVGRAIDRFGDRAVRMACDSIKKSWPDDNQALKGAVITALSRLFCANKHLDQARMIKVLSATDLGGLAANAEAMRKIMGGSTEVALSRALEGAYNKGLSTNKIAVGETR